MAVVRHHAPAIMLSILLALVAKPSFGEETSCSEVDIMSGSSSSPIVIIENQIAVRELFSFDIETEVVEHGIQIFYCSVDYMIEITCQAPETDEYCGPIPVQDEPEWQLRDFFVSSDGALKLMGIVDLAVSRSDTLFLRDPETGTEFGVVSPAGAISDDAVCVCGSLR